MTASSVRDAVSLANQRLTAAFAREDSIAVSRSYTSEAQVLPPQGEPIAGREAIAGFWQAGDGEWTLHRDIRNTSAAAAS